MELGGILILFWMGFSIGLSGALIPGPLLVYTINESLRKGRWTGLVVILGHTLVEVLVVLLFIYGLLEIIDSTTIFSTVSILGGIFLFYTSYELLKEANLGKPDLELKKKFAYPTVVGGILFTVLNPSFPLWWVTVGSRMLLEGLRQADMLGVWVIVAGHWLADFGWYIAVGFTASNQKETLMEKGWIKTLKKVMAAFLTVIGVYFLLSGLV
ncbi:MAG: LysE family transporter [Candidatus Altiarchaeota archaeon]